MVGTEFACRSEFRIQNTNMEEILDGISSLAINQPRSGVPMCMEMCPNTEMVLREKQGLLHRLEILDPEQWPQYKKMNWKKNSGENRIPFTNHGKAVKQYQRSSAGQSMNNFQMIRPTEVLRQTVDYLLTECFVLKIFDDDQSRFGRPETFDYCYDFVFDRLRSIRQDLIIQQAFDHHCLYIYERCIEFYIYSSYMWNHFSNVSSAKPPASFDAHINQTHLKECLQMLVIYYDSFNDSLWSRRRVTFESLFILFHLRPQIDLYGFRRYGKLKTTKLDCLLDRMPMIKSVIKSYLTQNHIRILRTITEAEIPKLLLVSFLITNVSIHHYSLIQLICKAYRSPTTTRLPLPALVKWFCPNCADPETIIDYLESLLKLYQIPVETYPPIDHFDDFNDQTYRTKHAFLNKNCQIGTFPPNNSNLIPTSWLEPFSLKAEIMKHFVPVLK